MAINTAKKRKTVSGIPNLAPGVTPNAARDRDWRFSAALNYIGFVYGLDNTEDRRAAAALPFFPVGVLPNANKGLQWRSEVGWGFLFTSFYVLGLATLSDTNPWTATLTDDAYESVTVEDEPL